MHLKIFHTEPPSPHQTEPPSPHQIEPPSPHQETEPPSPYQTEPPSLCQEEGGVRKAPSKRRRQAGVKDEIVDVDSYIVKNKHLVHVEKWLPHLKLSDGDKEVLLNPQGWLTDNLINAAQLLLKKASPHVSGLQDVTRGLMLSFDVEPGEFVQILNNQRGHWLTVSTIDCPHPTVSVYDSLCRSARTCLKSQIASLFHTQQPTIELNFMDCQIQSGRCDCGLFAIANTTALVLGYNPNKLLFDQTRMRQHLHQCLEKGCLLPFPTERSRQALKKVVTVDPFDVHCICRMPELVEDEKCGECTMCLKWYHIIDKCLNISLTSLEGDWLCSDCLS